MVIDASAVLAVLQQEAESAAFARAIASDETRLISAVNALEVSIVVEARRGTLGKIDVDTFLAKARVEIVPFGEDDLAEAHTAFRKFGKGRHPAGLNFCDCVAYALSKVSGEPLLFKGDDFSKTDIPAAAGARGVRDRNRTT